MLDIGSIPPLLNDCGQGSMGFHSTFHRTAEPFHIHRREQWETDRKIIYQFLRIILLIIKEVALIHGQRLI